VLLCLEALFTFSVIRELLFAFPEENLVTKMANDAPFSGRIRYNVLILNTLISFRLTPSHSLYVDSNFLTAFKYVGAGSATISMAGSAIGIGIIFGSLIVGLTPVIPKGSFLYY
jgi:hypothetical protein